MIKMRKLNRKVKMGKDNYSYCISGLGELNKIEYEMFTQMIKDGSKDLYYPGPNKSLLFKNKHDAQYFVMQTAFIRSSTPNVLNVNWTKHSL